MNETLSCAAELVSELEVTHLVVSDPHSPIDIANGLRLIDAFRAAGIEARLVDTPGSWDVEVVGASEAIASVLVNWMAGNGRRLTATSVGEIESDHARRIGEVGELTRDPRPRRCSVPVLFVDQ